MAGTHEPAAVDALAWVTAPAKLVWAGDGDEEREIEGVIESVEVAYRTLRFVLVPRIAAATDQVDHRVFVEKDAIEIAKAILGDHGINVELRVQRTLVKRAHCLQSFESDLDFVSRILAEEGIAWLSIPGSKGIRFADSSAAYADLEVGSFPFRDEAGMRSGPAIHQARLVRRVVQGETALRDYDFERPMLDQDVSASSGNGALRSFEYPGGYRDPSTGRALAAIRLQEARRGSVVLTGETNARGFFAGAVVTLSEGAEDEMNGRWLVIDVNHDGHEREGRVHPYLARFTAIPADSEYRPERRPPARLGGVQCAQVTGPAGSEIHTEAFARTRVKHRWDRGDVSDDKSSAWTRTVQPATSGSIFLPRVGWEVLLGFGGPRGDEPVLLGRLYNGSSPPPDGLPANKVVSAFGTQTTPGGGSVNKVSTNDTAGNEGMSFVASKNFNERTENDKVTAVKADDTWTIGASRKVIVGTVFEQSVSGAQSFTVGGLRTVSVGANLGLTAASESVLVGGLRAISTGGDHTTMCSTFTRLVGGGEAQADIEHQNRFVKGTSVLVNGASFSSTSGASAALGVGGASALRIGGGKSVTCSEYVLTAKGLISESYPSRTVTAGGDVTEGFSSSATYDISGAATMEGSDVSVTATGSITIKAGGVTVKMSGGSITITGKFDGGVASAENGSQTYG
jgi:type VI secretion system secreted protein VgrG